MHLYLVVEIYESPQTTKTKKKYINKTNSTNRVEYFLNWDIFVGIEKENKMKKKWIKQTRKLFGQNEVHKLSEIAKLQIEIN